MNLTFRLLVLCLSITMFISCTGDGDDFSSVVTLKVVNLIDGADNLIVKIGENPIDYATTKAKVPFEGVKNFPIVIANDTLTPVYSEFLNIRGINSLYLYGTLEDQSNLLIRDLPKQITDSLVGVRFLNLSKVSGPIDISIEGETETIISGLEYQSGSDYIEFPAKAINGSYRFKCIDTAGNITFRSTTSIETVDPLDEDDVSVMNNITLVITEREFASSTFYNIRRVNNY